MKSLKVYDLHVGGETLRCLMANNEFLPGNTIMEKLKTIKNNLAFYQKIILEPRGHNNMFGAVLSSPTVSDCHYDIVFFDRDDLLTMCGHASLCAAYLLTKLNKITKSKILFNTPAGKIELTMSSQKTGYITLKNVPSFVYALSRKTKIDTFAHEINYDIAYGGNFFAIVDVKQLNIDISKKNIYIFIGLAANLLQTINRQTEIKHPLNGNIDSVKLIEFSQETAQTNTVKTLVVWGGAQVDRSPCGTGTSAKMAVLAEKGILKIGQDFSHISVLGSVFKGKLIAAKSIEGVNFYTPTIEAHPHLIAESTLIFEDNDEFKNGFIFS